MKRIAARLGVSVASVHLWTRDIALTAEQRRKNQVGPGGPQSPQQIAERVKAWRAQHRQQRIDYQSEGRAAARLGNSLHQAGCMLYWAEGTKERNAARLVNSDPNMLRFYRRFLVESLGVAAEDMKIRLNVYLGNEMSLREIEQYWLDILELPRSSLRGHTLNHRPTSSSGEKRNRLPYGVCTLTVHRTRVVQHIFGAIQEYGGFEEPPWLD